MHTEKQLEADRLNAQKCTGPISVAGKAVSSMNALKTGIYANARIIRGENAEDLVALTGRYYSRWSPATPEECFLIDALISNDWLLRRLHAVEAQLWELQASTPTRTREGLELAQAISYDDKSFDRLQRRMNSVQRNFQSALRDLQRLKSQPREIRDDRPSADWTALPPATPQKQSDTPSGGFVPSPPPAAMPHIVRPAQEIGPVPKEPQSARATQDNFVPRVR